jgi:excisionase family DNA binding protein
MRTATLICLALALRLCLSAVASGEQLLTVEQAAERLAIGRTLAYSLVKERRLRSIHINTALRIPASAVDEFIRAQLLDADEPAEE